MRPSNTKHNWIKCSDRMPKYGKEVFVSDGKSRSIGYYVKALGWYPSKTFGAGYESSVELKFWPTHWQELPALPE